MVICFETNFVAYYAYFTAKLHKFLEGQFENLVFVIMSTRENICLIARTSLLFYMQQKLGFLVTMPTCDILLFLKA